MAKEVFIFGAGFTKAFCPEAPLLTTKLDDGFVKRFSVFPQVAEIFESQYLDKNRLVNLESLFTRLYSGMPYDERRGDGTPLRFVLSEFLDWLSNKLAKATSAKIVDLVKGKPNPLLWNLASYCLYNQVNCITFGNYPLTSRNYRRMLFLEQKEKPYEQVHDKRLQESVSQ